MYQQASDLWVLGPEAPVHLSEATVTSEHAPALVRHTDLKRFDTLADSNALGFEMKLRFHIFSLENKSVR